MVIALRSQLNRLVHITALVEAGFMRIPLLALAAALSLADSASSAADRIDPKKVVETPQEAVEAEVEAMARMQVEEMLKGRPAEPGWAERGIDIVERLRREPGGVDGTILVAADEESKSISYYGSRNLPLSGFTAAYVSGETQSSAIRVQDVSQVDGRIWVASDEPIRRVGKAYCSAGSTRFQLLLPAGDEPTGEEAAVIRIMSRIETRLRAVDICIVTIEQADGTFTSHSYLPDGRALPALDEDVQPYRLRPFEDAAAILTP